MTPFAQIPIAEPSHVPPETAELKPLWELETAARVTYGLACDRVELLRPLEREHRQAADRLRRQMGILEDPPLDRPPPLGVWADAARLAAGGPLADLLRALRQAELSLQAAYEHAAAASPEQEHLFQDLLIPAQQRHLRLLDQLIGGLDPRKWDA